MPVATAASRPQADRALARPIPLYLLQGEDEVEKSALAHEFEELVEEGLRAFNVERIHAGDVTTGDKLAAAVASLVTAARTLPMMAPRRVVIVLQAEALLVPKRESEAATRALRSSKGCSSSQNRRRRWCWCRRASIDKRSRMYKLLAKHATLVDLRDCIENPADAERWVRNRVIAADSADRCRPARGCSPSAAAPTSSASATTSIGCCCTRSARRRHQRRRCAGDRRSGGAAGRLGDDQRDRGRRRGRLRCASWR